MIAFVIGGAIMAKPKIKIPIDMTHKNDIKKFIEDNIVPINKQISEFSKKEHPDLEYDATDIKRWLLKKFRDELDNAKKAELWNAFEAQNYTKGQIVQIAIDNVFYHKDLELFYQSSISDELTALIDEKMLDSVTEAILNCTIYDDKKKKYIKQMVSSCVEKALYIALKNGFSLNINNVEEGVMTANAGDSAQFLFLARAILAGYNCSNVDVRSSRYDAIIDYKGKLFKIQIKGISGTTINFKDRDRGGRGIDTQNEHNKGKRITLQDCDIYVAVDKQIGICYIIPMKDVDPMVWEKDTMTLNEAQKYRENWHIIDDLL